MMSRRLKVVLGASLLLNLFLVTGVAGAGFIYFHHRHHLGPQTLPTSAWLARAQDMPEADRARLDTLVRTAALSGEADIAKARALREEAAQLAAQATYDTPRIMALSEQARALEAQARARVENAMITGLEAERPEVRSLVISHLLRASFRYRRFVPGEGPQRDLCPKSGEAGAPRSDSR